MKKSITIILFLSFLFIQSSTACVCKDFVVMPSVVKEDLQDSDMKFVEIEVISVETIIDKKATREQPKWRKKRRLKIRYNLATVKIFKNYNANLDTETIQIKTGLFPHGDCGFPFKERRKYLITMVKRNNYPNLWHTSICLPSRPLENAMESIILLEEYFKK